MRLPTFRKLNKNDYIGTYQDLVERLAFTLNLDIEAIYTALQGRLTFADNFAGTVVNFSITTDTTGKPLNPVTIKLTSQNTVTGTQVINAVTNPKGTSFPTGTPFCTFEQTSDSLKIINCQGLPANIPFNIQLLIYQG